MSPDKWKLVKNIFSEAVELPTAERAPFVREQAEGDEAIVDEVNKLLKSDKAAENFIEEPAVDISRLLSDESDMVGKHLGPYVIEKKIGAGGMGTVYLGRHFETQEEAAVKVLPASLARRPSLMIREGKYDEVVRGRVISEQLQS